MCYCLQFFFRIRLSVDNSEEVREWGRCTDQGQSKPGIDGGEEDEMWA